MTDIGRPEPPERGLLARIAVDITPLRESRDFRRLWVGTGISAIGSQITTVAIPFQLYELTGSTLLVGMLGLAALVPLLTVPLYAAFGLPVAFGIDIATFAASLLAIWLLPPAPPSPDADRPSLQSILEGFRYVRRRKVLLGIFVVDTNAMIFGMPRALLPAFAEKLGGGAGLLGLMYSAPFFGALVASLTSGWMMTVRRQGLGVCVAAAAWGAAIAFVGFAEAAWFALAFLAVAGAADFVSAVLRSNILLAATPDEMRGRLSGIELAQVAGAPELGNVEAGVVAELASVRASIVSGGVLTVVGTIAVAAAIPALVRYDAPRPMDE